MNRNYIGIEKDPTIFNYACERVGLKNLT